MKNTQHQPPWYVITRSDNGYPVIVYPDKERAEFVAQANGYKVVAVIPIKQIGGK